MEHFDTFSQFDKQFTSIGSFGNDRSACPVFGLVTCYNFMLNGSTTKEQHEHNLKTAINNYATSELKKYMNFDDVCNLTDSIKPNNVNATNPELMNAGIISYEHMFKFDAEQRYCILFLKNRNFIAVLCDKNKFAVRDCHETNQKTFNNFEEFRTYLENTYQFGQQTVVDGVRIEEFENIEFVTIDDFFSVAIDVPQLEAFEDNKEEFIEDNKEIQIDYTNEYVQFDEMLAASLADEEYVEF